LNSVLDLKRLSHRSESDADETKTKSGTHRRIVCEKREGDQTEKLVLQWGKKGKAKEDILTPQRHTGGRGQQKKVRLVTSLEGLNPRGNLRGERCTTWVLGYTPEWRGEKQVRNLIYRKFRRERVVCGGGGTPS